MVSDPEEAFTTSPFTVAPVLTSVHSDVVVVPVDLITGLNPFNLSAYGLRARWPTLRAQHYCCDSQGLATRWLAKPSKMGFSPIRLHGIARSLQNRRPDPKRGVIYEFTWFNHLFLSNLILTCCPAIAAHWRE
jgi:hypothetical protein